MRYCAVFTGGLPKLDIHNAFTTPELSKRLDSVTFEVTSNFIILLVCVLRMKKRSDLCVTHLRMLEKGFLHLILVIFPEG